MSSCRQWCYVCVCVHVISTLVVSLSQMNCIVCQRKSDGGGEVGVMNCIVCANAHMSAKEKVNTPFNITEM